ncbi:MAG: putative hydroxymethylpyrimidine transporter CytX [Bacteroides sp.]|nr:putative hydroxymethylpyrimidine transporter CytX [Prevotella sp.]MCM1406923.1 putative hydroxymethylpyrimidine transporter CytX [Treponema brennaborense]MCM1470074.1 putative hydroxymethylpyrimidine transporter CytX [Bacteroides sp.]
MNIKSKEANLALIWFGAGVSVAEIITGTYFAPLGFAKGAAAILIGHVIGCALLFLAGYIGCASQKSAMETTKRSFGIFGGKFFALVNVLQLTGWTGIMIYDGSLSVNALFANSARIWALVIGTLILLWIALGITRIGKLSAAALTALFALTLVLCKVIFFGGNAPASNHVSESALSFGAAVELAVAMPLSWLPLVSDYTRESSRPLASSLVSSAVYGITSCWMYVIGMGAALFTGETDISLIMLKANLGWAAIAIVVLSTVTTTFLDAYSAGISFEAIVPSANGKWIAAAVTAAGTIGALFFPMDDITGFLYLIGSVFAPMSAILIADFFVLKTDFSEKKCPAAKAVLWLAGFVLYRISLGWDFILGNTIPVMAAVFAAAVIAGKLFRPNGKKTAA